MTEATLHVGFVLEWFPPHVGGVETLFDQLTRGLVERGHEVTVVTTRMRGSLRAEVRHGVRIVRVPTPDFLQRYFFTVLAVPVALWALRGVDVIHTTTYNAAVAGWLASRFRRRPAVVTVHEVWGEQWNRLNGLSRVLGYAFRAYEWSVLQLPFSRFVCDSRFTERRLRTAMGVPPPLTTVVYPAVDYGFWDAGAHTPADRRTRLGAPDGAFVYLYFGRPGVSKGLEFLIDAAVEVRARRPDSRLVLVLSPDPAAQHAELRRRIAHRGLEDHVTVLDPVPRHELPGLLLAADCICIPSISEGFGYAAVEAALLGRPVVATTGHSVEEVMPGAAVFVPPVDPAALAGALLRVADGERPGTGVPGGYDITAHLDGIERVYREIVAPGV
jgi:glycosyltransferase involved in cell wall biosynthesis